MEFHAILIVQVYDLEEAINLIVESNGVELVTFKCGSPVNKPYHYNYFKIDLKIMYSKSPVKKPQNRNTSIIIVEGYFRVGNVVWRPTEAVHVEAVGWRRVDARAEAWAKDTGSPTRPPGHLTYLPDNITRAQSNSHSTAPHSPVYPIANPKN